MQKENRNNRVHTGEQSGKTDFLIERLLPVGKENAITTQDLVKLSGCGSARELQQRIAYEREQGAIICSGSGRGYWRPKDRQEIQEFVHTMNARALNTLKAVKSAKRALRLEMFGSSFCRSVYAEILKAYDAGKQITLISIAQKLQGESFSQERIMQELKGILPDIQAYKIKSYADALVAEYKTRRLKEMLSKIIPAAGIVDEQINTMLQELEAMKENDTVKIHALSEIVDSISDGYFKEPDTEPLYTGLEKLDNTLGGLEGGDMIVIGARPAVGKSAFVTQIAINLADRKKKIAFYNLEMSDKQVYERLLSRKSRIGLNRIRRARSFLGDEKDRFDKANQELKKSTLFIRSGAVTVEVLDMLKYSYIGEVPREIIQSIFQKYDSGLIGLCQVFIYGVIEGKRAERARRKAHNV